MKALLLVATLLFAAPVAAAAAAPSLAVSVSAPARVAFGDTFQLSVRVRFDPKVVDASSVSADTVRGPLTALAPPSIGRVAGELHQTQTVACLDAECVASRGKTARSIVLPAVRARARAQTGGALTAVATPTAMVVDSRLTPAEANAHSPQYLRQTSLSAPRFRLAPNLLAAIALLGALLLLAVAAAVTRGRRPGLDLRTAMWPREGPLERALRLVRASFGRPPADRRRALDLLATALEDRRDDATADATRLAWSAPEPTEMTVEPLLHGLDGGDAR